MFAFYYYLTYTLFCTISWSISQILPEYYPSLSQQDLDFYNGDNYLRIYLDQSECTCIQRHQNSRTISSFYYTIFSIKRKTLTQNCNIFIRYQFHELVKKLKCPECDDSISNDCFIDMTRKSVIVEKLLKRRLELR